MKKPIDPTSVREVMECTAQAGDFVRLARLARNLTQVQLAERMMASRDTVARLEAGEPGVSVGHFFAALWCMGLDRVLGEALVPEADALGRDRRLREARGRTRPVTKDELERKMDF